MIPIYASTQIEKMIQLLLLIIIMIVNIIIAIMMKSKLLHSRRKKWKMGASGGMVFVLE